MINRITLLFIFTSTAITYDVQYGSLDLLGEIQLGPWYLAAGGSNTPDAAPPTTSCVKVTVTDTGNEAECLFNNFNYTTHKVRIVTLTGMNEQNDREIYSVAPIHQWLDTEKAYRWHVNEPRPPPEAISLNSLAKSTICWHPKDHKFISYTFTVTAISLDSLLRAPTIPREYDYLYLVGVNAALPRSELHVALLVKEKVSRYEVERMIKKIEDVLLEDGGKWILSAAGSNGVMPDFESCIQLTITDTGKKAGCILVAHNHNVQKIRILKFIGRNLSNRTEIISQGPVYQYMVKGRDEKNIDPELRYEVDWDAAVNSPVCWHGKTKQILQTKYIITPIENSTDHFYLVAVSAGTPMPEYQVAILTKEVVKRNYLIRLKNIVNYRNYEKLDARSDTPGLFVNSGLPNVQMKCADGYDPDSSVEKRYKNLPQNFDINFPPFQEAKTYLVKHQ